MYLVWSCNCLYRDLFQIPAAAFNSIMHEHSEFLSLLIKSFAFHNDRGSDGFSQEALSWKTCSILVLILLHASFKGNVQYKLQDMVWQEMWLKWLLNGLQTHFDWTPLVKEVTHWKLIIFTPSSPQRMVSGRNGPAASNNTREFVLTNRSCIPFPMQRNRFP